ncbi:amino acid adenylation domain-containing protein [Micromonospora sp. NPDC051925]|uniref:amino acid adenylation domain-containing protein n=1 Tax=Micromonospora sp. NPDC051925 TaxID=3364288 RepID=UPI0037C95049
MGDTAGRPETVHACVARHAAQRPDAPAIIYGREVVTYGILDAAADVYAAQLAAHGVGPAAVVPLLLPRSPQLVAVQLAVLKRGAAYAGLDVRWPPSRLSVILEQVAPAFVATPEDFPTDDLARVAARRADPAGASVVDVDGMTPAMVFFTSGTTGGPKGVVSPHRAVTRLFGHGGLAGFGPGHATPQVAPLPWDMYAFELWGQLCSGGTSVLVGEDHLLPGTLRRLIRTVGVDTLWLTTSLFNLFVDEDVESFAGLRQLYVGGEKLSPSHVRRCLQEHPRLPVHNGYGPAESCMLTTTRRITLEDCDVPEGIPVGAPVPGTRVFVLGPDDRPCPPGQAGEICIAGTGLATGYLGRPEQTTQRFVHVHIGDRRVRMYRTGDRGVFDASGCLHFLGRDDRQIKINGFRIELGEIEAAARQVPGVRDCVALPVTGADGQVLRLALCYVQSEAEPGGDVDGDPLDLRGHLAQALPAYLVPAAIRAIDAFPLNANGKRDTAALLRLVLRPTRPVRQQRTLPR